MNYALIGCGRISPNHIVAAKNNNLNIIAICDIVLENMEDKIIKFDLDVKKYSDYKKMLDENEIDLVSIATESGKHAEIAKYCITKGINCIIEKPIALSIKDADDIIELSKKYNVKVSACHQNRFNLAIQEIWNAKTKNRFGKLMYGTAHIRWNRGYEYYARAKWRGTWEQDGGALMNQCIHNIDLLRWIMGSDIDEVFAYTDKLNHDYISAEDLGIALIKFKNGTYGIIEGTTDIYPQNLEETLYIFGTKGTAKAGGISVNAIDVWNFSDMLDDPVEIIRSTSETPPNVYGYGHTPLFKNVIDSIINNTEPLVSAIEGKKALELVLAIYKSQKEKKPIKLPLKDFSTLDMIGEFDDK